MSLAPDSSPRILCLVRGDHPLVSEPPVRPPPCPPQKPHNILVNTDCELKVQGRRRGGGAGRRLGCAEQAGLEDRSTVRRSLVHNTNDDYTEGLVEDWPGPPPPGFCIEEKSPPCLAPVGRNSLSCADLTLGIGKGLCVVYLVLVVAMHFFPTSRKSRSTKVYRTATHFPHCLPVIKRRREGFPGSR